MVSREKSDSWVFQLLGAAVLGCVLLNLLHWLPIEKPESLLHTPGFFAKHPVSIFSLLLGVLLAVLAWAAVGLLAVYRSQPKIWPVPLTETSLLIAIVVVYIGTGLIDPNHSYFDNWDTSVKIILRNTAVLGIIALGAAVVIIAGGIDLSVGSMMAFSASTCALILVVFAEPTDQRLFAVGPVAISCALGGSVMAGLLIGTLHTWLITSIRLPPFVATLATLVGLRSFARAMCEFVTEQRWGSKTSEVYVTSPFFQELK